MVTTKLINISNACKAGCLRDQQVERFKRIIKLARALRSEPVQSRSIERRFATLIEAEAEAGLK